MPVAAHRNLKNFLIQFLPLARTRRKNTLIKEYSLCDQLKQSLLNLLTILFRAQSSLSFPVLDRLCLIVQGSFCIFRDRNNIFESVPCTYPSFLCSGVWLDDRSE